MSSQIVLKYQLWCFYDTESEWIMEGFFNNKKEADNYAVKLREDIDTPAMSVWEVVLVNMFYP